MISLTTFLVLLALWRPPVERSIAESLLEIGPLSPQQAMPNLEQAFETSEASADFDQLLAEVVAKLQVPPSTDVSVHPETETSPDHSATNGAENSTTSPTDLRIETRRDPERDVRWIRVRFAGRDSDLAVQTVRRAAADLEVLLRQQLAARAIGNANNDSDQASSDEADQIALLEQARELAKQELEQYVTREVGRLKTEWEATQRPAGSSADGSTPIVVFSPQVITNSPKTTNPELGSSPPDGDALLSQSDLEVIPNPDYMRLEESLKSRRRQRQELLERQTGEHPQVKMLDAKIEELENQLSQTAPTVDLAAGTIPVNGETPANNAKDNLGLDNAASNERSLVIDNVYASNNNVAGMSATDQQSESSSPTAVTNNSTENSFDEQAARQALEQSPTHQQLAERLHQADSAVHAARAAVVVSPEPPAAANVSVRIVHDATLLAGIRAPLNRNHLSATGLCATTLAFGLLLIPGRRDPLTVFIDPKTVATRLGLNLVGSLPSGDGPPMPSVPPRHISSLAKRCVHVGEWLIVAIGLTVMTMAVVDSHVGTQLRANPLQAYLAAVDGLTEIIINPRG